MVDAPVLPRRQLRTKLRAVENEPMEDSHAFRDARFDDLAAIVALLADDVLGSGRESAGPVLDSHYEEAFAAIEADPRSRLILMDIGGTVVGCYQITFVPGLSHKGATRAIVEGVRIDAARRGQGLGRDMMRHAIAIARLGGAKMVQLSSNKVRTDAHRFYEGLDFERSHEGFKLVL